MYREDFQEVCSKILLDYTKLHFKEKLTDFFLKIQNGKGEQHQLYQKYIKDIEKAENFDKILKIYMEAYDLLQSKSPITPYSKTVYGDV